MSAENLSYFLKLQVLEVL